MAPSTALSTACPLITARLPPLPAHLQVRLYDLRAKESANGSPVASCYAHAKAVCGVCVDPYQPTRFVTHSEDADGLVRGPMDVWPVCWLSARRLLVVSGSLLLATCWPLAGLPIALLIAPLIEF